MPSGFLRHRVGLALVWLAAGCGGGAGAPPHDAGGDLAPADSGDVAPADGALPSDAVRPDVGFVSCDECGNPYACGGLPCREDAASCTWDPPCPVGWTDGCSCEGGTWSCVHTDCPPDGSEWADTVSDAGAAEDAGPDADAPADAGPDAGDPAAALAGSWDLELRLDRDGWSDSVAGQWLALWVDASTSPGLFVMDLVGLLADALPVGRPLEDPEVAAAEEILGSFEDAVLGQAVDCALPRPDVCPAFQDFLVSDARLRGRLALVADGPYGLRGEVQWIGVTVGLPERLCAPLPHPERTIPVAELAAWSTGLSLSPTSWSGSQTEVAFTLGDQSIAFDPGAFLLYAAEAVAAGKPDLVGVLGEPCLDCAAAFAGIDDAAFAAAGIPREDWVAGCESALDAIVDPIDLLAAGVRVRGASMVLTAATFPRGPGEAAAALGPWELDGRVVVPPEAPGGGGTFVATWTATR